MADDPDPGPPRVGRGLARGETGGAATRPVEDASTIAVFSDVHGNTPALRVVLDDVARRGVDVVVNLGDVASGGVDPRGTLDLLRSAPEVLTVRGNHERQLLAGDPTQMSPSDRLAHGVLTPEDRRWLESLRPTVLLQPGVLAFHASPRDDVQHLLHTVTPAGLREATDDEVEARLGADRSGHQLLLCGHTHLQGARRLGSGTLVVNPGSVGWPAYSDDHPVPHVVEAGSPHARYSVVRRSGALGPWHVQHLALEYPVAEAAAMAEANGRPDVAAALRTGRVGRAT